MMEDTSFLDERVYNESASQKGMKWFGRVLAVIIILTIFAFGDIMYLQLMSGKFPSGPLMIMCYIGAFSSFLAVVYMLIGKSGLFTPGKQTIIAWVAVGLELALVAMNIILVFQGTANATGFLEFWDQVAPATPVVNVAIVMVLYFLDEDMLRRHEDIELQNTIDRYDRKYTKEFHKNRTRIRMRQLDYASKALEQAVNSQESLDYIADFGFDMNAQLLQNLTGKPAPQLRPTQKPTIVQADQPKQIAAPQQGAQTKQQSQGFMERVKRGVKEVSGIAQDDVAVPTQKPPMVTQQYAQTATTADPEQWHRQGREQGSDARRHLIEARRRQRQQRLQRFTSVPQAQPVTQPVPPVVPVQETVEGRGAPQAKNVRKGRPRKVKESKQESPVSPEVMPEENTEVK
jgi:hypothetical protein